MSTINVNTLRTAAGASPVLVSEIAKLTDVSAVAADLAAPTGSSLVGYMPAGVGAVATTVQGKLRDIVSVKDFGAVGDGVTDDTAALRIAFAAINNTGRTLELKEHLISGTLEAPSNATISGGGLHFTGVLADPYGAGSNWGYAIRINNAYRTRIIGVSFYSNSDVSGQYSSDAIVIDLPDNPLVPVTSGSASIEIAGCIFNKITRFGIKANCVGGRNWVITNNIFNLVGGDATKYYTGASSEGVMAGFDLIYSDNLTSAREFVNNLVFTGNVFLIDLDSTDYHGVAFKVQGCKNSVIANNVVSAEQGAYSVIDYSSAMVQLFVIGSVVSNNAFGKGVVNIPSLYLTGCQDSLITNTVVGGFHVRVLSYIRNAGTTQFDTSNLTIDGVRVFNDPVSAYSPYAPWLHFGDSVVLTHKITGVRVTNFTGSLFNKTTLDSSNIKIHASTIKGVVYSGLPATYGKITLTSCDIASVYMGTDFTISSVKTLQCENLEISNCNITGSATGTGGDYAVKIKNTTLTNNAYYLPVGNAYSGIVGFIAPTASDISALRYSVVNESGRRIDGLTSFLYTVYNPFGYEKSYLYDGAPAGAKWIRGEYTENTQPSPSGYMGRICTTSGYAVKGAWTTGVAYVIGDWVSNGGNIYRATTAGTAGATAPVHTTGTASDGTVTWLFIATSAVAVFKNAGLIAT